VFDSSEGNNNGGDGDGEVSVFDLSINSGGRKDDTNELMNAEGKHKKNISTDSVSEYDTIQEEEYVFVCG
jgi:hypothetical protein